MALSGVGLSQTVPPRRLLAPIVRFDVGAFSPRCMDITLRVARPSVGYTGRPPDADGVNCLRSRRDRLAEILIAHPRMLPRQVLPRRFYLITRRCAPRQFLLRPDAATNNAFLYCLIDAALRCGEARPGMLLEEAALARAGGAAYQSERAGDKVREDPSPRSPRRTRRAPAWSSRCPPRAPGRDG